MKKRTEQETFWEGEFGDNYINRNKSEKLLASNLSFFSKALNLVESPKSVVEFGANIGMNLMALKSLFPKTKFEGIEINKSAVIKLNEVIGKNNVSHCSITDYKIASQFDLVLIKTVLIHISPILLPQVYEKLYNSSNKYILICEYYNPSPATINYRGHSNKLFKRDFAGEMMDTYKNLRLKDYGFVYHRDSSFPQDDITWFLLEK